MHGTKVVGKRHRSRRARRCTWRGVGILVLTVFVFTGCEVKNPFQSAPSGDALVPDTPKAEILAEVRPALKPLRDVLNPVPGVSTGLNEQTRLQVVQALREAQAKYGQMKTGQEAFAELAAEISGVARLASQDDRWLLVQGCIDAYEILNMQSFYLERLDDRAKEMLERPTVVVKGFMKDEERNHLYVFLELTNRNTKETRKVRAREGEEFDNLKILEVVGSNESVRFEYLPIEGLVFTVEAFK